MIKSKETLIEVLKEKYSYENERKRYYDNIITLPVTLLGFIVAGTYVIIAEKSVSNWFEETKPWIMYPLITVTIVSVVLLFMVFFGLKRKYCSFPETKVVMRDYNRLIQYYNTQTTNTNNIDDKLDDDLNDFVIQWYCDINNNNTKVNDLRMNIFHISKIFIGISYLLGILVFSFYCYSKINSESMATDNNNPQQQQSANPPAKPADAPSSTPKPSPSPVRFEKAEKNGGKLK